MSRGWGTEPNPDNLSIYPLIFSRSSTSSDYYIRHPGPSGEESDYVPALVPYASRIVQMTFSNEDQGVDVDVEIYRAPIGVQNSAATLISTVQIRNRRALCQCLDIEVNACDKIAIYLRDRGKNPDNPVIHLWLTPLDLSCVTAGDDLGSDFPNQNGGDD